MPEPVPSALADALAGAARALLGARAASIALLDRGTRELVFAGVSGDGARELSGARFAHDEGLAGEVLRSGRAAAIGDVAADPHFAGDIATETGYVPDAMLLAPLAAPAGVISVLDPAPDTALETLVAFAALAEQVLALPGPATAA